MRTILILLCLWLPLLPRLSPAEDDESIREICRRQIAGAYLTTYNQWLRTKDYAKLLKKQMQELVRAEASAKRDYATKEKEVEQHEYDVDRQRALSAAKTRWESIQVQIAETKDLTKKTTVEHEMAHRELEKLKKAMAPVFTITTASDSSSNFPYTVEYKSPCPKYRYTCPLPNKDAYRLQDIPLAGDECKQYVTFSLGMNRN